MVETQAEFLLVDRVERELRRQVAQYRDVPNAMLPQQHVLAKNLGVSRRTVRLALDRLHKDKLIHSSRGKGTFVMPARTTRTNVVLVCGDPHHMYNMMAIATLSTLLKGRGLASNIVISPQPLADRDKICRNGDDLCGIVLLGSYTRKSIQPFVEQCEYPLVHIGDLAEEVREPALCDNVINDSVAIAYRGTECLIRRGHRRISLLTTDTMAVWAREHYRGHVDALKRHGIEADESLIVALPNPLPGIATEEEHRAEFERAAKKVAAWRKKGNGPTALIHSTASESWLRDLLHIGFDDYFSDEAIVGMIYREYLPGNYSGYRPATVACVKFQELAARALDLLVRPRVPGEPPRREILEQTYLYLRRNGVWQEENPFRE